jgi:hypothetical protein
MNTATLLKDNLPEFRGHAALYKLSTRLAARDFDDNVTAKYKYVVVSAVYAYFSGPETYIFPADKNGTVVSWTELPGSYRGGLDHAKALKHAGYTIR